jgi:hypothetical protein
MNEPSFASMLSTVIQVSPLVGASETTSQIQGGH